MGNLSQVNKIYKLLALVLISRLSICVEIDSSSWSEEVLESEYNAYYSEVEKQRTDHLKDDISDEPKITLFNVLWPFILTFWVTFLIIAIVLGTIFCICLLQAFDWTTICQPLEYLPCQGHALLSKRLERLKTPGVYIRKDGFKEYYSPIDNELEIANDIQNRLQIH